MDKMRFRESLSSKSLIVNLIVTVFQLVFITVITVLVLTPVFRALDENADVISVNRSLDSIEAAARSIGVMARGLAMSPSESDESIMDIFSLDFLAVSDGDGRFENEGIWIRGPNGVVPASAFEVRSLDRLTGEFAAAPSGNYWIFEAKSDDGPRWDLYIAVIGVSGNGRKRLVLGRRLEPFLRVSVPITVDVDVITTTVPENHRYPVIQANDNLLRGRLFREIGIDDIVLSLEGERRVAETIIDVPFLGKGLLLRLDIPWYSREYGARTIRQITLLHAVSFLIIISISTLWVYIKVSRPMRRLVRGIGTWDGLRFPDFGSLKDRRDEVGEISRAFIHMSGEVRSKTKSLEDQARRDGLTGLYNRRSFDEMIVNEWSRHKRDNVPLALVMADIDHFKAYNDIFGHQAGDECLRLVSRAFGSGVKRPGDHPFRYGGEEFALILAGTDLEGAKTVAEAVRKAVCDLNMEHTGNPVEGIVTMSFGTAAVAPESESSTEELIRDADDALYKAKKAGRNCVR